MMNYDAIILGGGLTGLSAGYELSKNGKKVLVLEQDNDLGGVLSSHNFQHFNIEKYYHHVPETDGNFFGLIKELGLEDQLFCRTASVGYLIDNKTYKLDTPMDILRFSKLSLMDKIKLGIITIRSKFIKNYVALDAITAKDWLIQQGCENIYNNFFKPLIYGKFGDSADRISAAWLISRIKFRSNRSLKGERLYYMKNGFKTLIDKLADRIKSNGEIKTGLKAEQIVVDGNKVTGVKAGGQYFSSSTVISTLPPKILLDICKMPEDISAILRKIKFQGIICALVGLDRNLTDTYWLNIGRSDVPFCLIVEHTNFYDRPEYGAKMVYVCSYVQDTGSSFWKKGDKEIFAMFLESLKDIFGIKDNNVLWYKLSRDRFAAPVYSLGYLSLIPPYATPIKGLFIAGMMQSYPDRGIDNSILQGKKCAHIMLDSLA